ncbi:response regulator [Desulfosoma caldarium]|uniref:CheY-like chemotaxis protein n=1 Tax=Desulfosoma caldarium TaxID=610254 RepID=A0A3N1UMR4_9BACT|nr:response regulator [Desulfosoma caldarium]ROQ91038.1 CheY-like chemotaxis protein [Desulfosoma caldarium]
MKKVWVVCEDCEFVERLHHAAGQLGLQTTVFSDLTTLAEAPSQDNPAIIFVDLDTSVPSEAQLVRTAALFPRTPLIALSRRTFHPELAQAFAQHLRVCLRKPVDMNEVSFWLRSFTRDAPS